MIVLRDPDCLLWAGDVRDGLAMLPAGSVDCVVTSPPYYGLRDYGMDGQIGLEESPDAFLAALVDVFRGVRRALADHGSLWVNMGDTYAAGSAPRPPRAPDNGNHGAGQDRVHHDGYAMHFRAAAYTNQPRSFAADVPRKSLLAMPWRLAIALMADGWILRRDIIWSKPNPLPESVNDRCPTAHEYVFHLTKRPSYWYDWRACPEATDDHWRDVWERHPKRPLDANPDSPYRAQDALTHGGGIGTTDSVRPMRSVWTIAGDPTPDAHFATYPRELVRRCVRLSCPLDVCRACATPRSRIVETALADTTRTSPPNKGHDQGALGERAANLTRDGWVPNLERTVRTIGWTDCGCDAGFQPGVVLDPFVGSGTTCKVARDQGMRSVGLDLNPAYLDIARRRLAQLSLLAEVAP